MPSEMGILVYRDSTSNVKKISESRMERSDRRATKWEESLIKEGELAAMGWRKESMYASTAADSLEQPETIGLPGGQI